MGGEQRACVDRDHLNYHTDLVIIVRHIGRSVLLMDSVDGSSLKETDGTLLYCTTTGWER